jgi:hypothetical protein
MPAALLPKGTRLNTNGAGDAYTSGLLVASMLRHTGNIVSKQPIADESSPRKEEVSPSKRGGAGSRSGGKKMTPYTLYMQQNYVMLKQQCQGDKKAMFTMCHEMWESESDEVKGMYQRMVKEEYGNDNETGSDFSLEGLDVSNITSSTASSSDVQFEIERTEHASLNLESAVQFAGLVAANHVDTSTRDLSSLDLGSLLEASIVSLSQAAPNPNEI